MLRKVSSKPVRTTGRAGFLAHAAGKRSGKASIDLSSKGSDEETAQNRESGLRVFFGSLMGLGAGTFRDIGALCEARSLPFWAHCAPQHGRDRCSSQNTEMKVRGTSG